MEDNGHPPGQMPPDRAFRIISSTCSNTQATYPQHLLIQEALGVVRDMMMIALDIIEANTPNTAPSPGKEKIIPMPGIEPDPIEH